MTRSVLKNLDCSTCRAALITDDPNTHTSEPYRLIRIRDNGGLYFPSRGTLRVLLATERHLRARCSDPQRAARLTCQHLVSLVMRDMMCTDPMELGTHAIETAYGIDI